MYLMCYNKEYDIISKVIKGCLMVTQHFGTILII